MAKAKSATFMLHVTVVEAKGISVPNSINPFASLSDCFCKVRVTHAKKKKFQTRKVTSQNPVWDESFSFVLQDLTGDLILKVKDYNTMMKDRFLGFVRFRLSEMKDLKHMQGWFDLTDKGEKNRMSGSVFVKLVIDRDWSHVQSKDPTTFAKHVRTLTHNLSKEYDQKEPGKATFSILVGSWNVGNKPPPDDLSAWIPLNPPPNIVVLGAQECDYKPRKPYKFCHQDWRGTIQNYFATRAPQLGMELVESSELQQIRLVVFADAKTRKYITEKKISNEATGLGHVWGNKGGAAISFNLKDASIVFVNSHLAAHQHKVKQRNADVAEIIQGVRIGYRGADVLCQFTHVVWMGDLNYRLNYKDQEEKSPAKEDFDEIVKMIEDKKYGELFATDQLALEMKEGNVFKGFHEGPCNFSPTFKVQRDKLLEYNPQRSPAWCDRILWRSWDDSKLEQKSFSSAEAITTSDHKPVFGTFQCEVQRLPTGRSADLGDCVMTVRNLKGRDLLAADLTGQSDPYIWFHCPAFTQSVRTPFKNQTRNPDWNDNEVPEMKLSVNAKARLRRSAVTVVVFDYDAGRKDDTIGCGTLFLKDFVDADDEKQVEQHSVSKAHYVEKAFKLDLTFGGLPAGTLEGTLRLAWADSDFEPILLTDAPPGSPATANSKK